MMCFGISFSNHIIFEQVGEMASSVNYIHIKLDLDLDGIDVHLRHYRGLLYDVKTAFTYNERFFADNAARYRTLIHTHLNSIHKICDRRITKTNSIEAAIANLRETLPQVDSIKDDAIRLKRSTFKQSVEDAKRNLANSVLKAGINQAASILIRQSRTPVSLALGTLGTFMGLYNTMQIQTLKKDLQNTQDAHNRLVEVVQGNSHKIAEQKQDMTLLIKTINATLALDINNLAAELIDVEQGLWQRINQATHIIQTAQNHRLAIDALPANSLQILFQKIEQQAKQMDHKLIISKPSDLFQLELTYFYNGKSMQMLLHVPAVPKDSILRLLKLHPFPLPLNKNYSVIPMVQDDLLGLSAGFHRYSMQLSSVDLMGCHAVNNIYLCEKHGVLGKNLNNSCLGSLYLQNYDLAQTLCPLHIMPSREVVRQLLNNWFLIFSPDPQTAPISCRNGTQNEYYFKTGITRAFLSPGCKMNLKEHLLQSDFSISLPDEIVHFVWDQDLSMQFPDVNSDIMELIDSGLTTPTLTDLKELKIRKRKLTPFTLIITFIVATSALALGSIIFLWIFYRDVIMSIPFVKKLLTPKLISPRKTNTPIPQEMSPF